MTDTYLAPAPAPRQLDIIADTALAAKYSASSTARPPAKYSASSTAPNDEKYSASSTAAEIEKKRKAAGLSHEDLCRIAGVSIRNWFRILRGDHPAKPSTLKRLGRAVERRDAALLPSDQRAFHVSYLWRLIRDLARQRGWDPELMVSQDFSAENTNDPVWLQASRLRRCAIYLLVEGLLDGRRAPIAKAVGISRQAVHKSVAAIEAERMRDSEFDAWMQRAMDEVKPR